MGPEVIHTVASYQEKRGPEDFTAKFEATVKGLEDTRSLGRNSTQHRETADP